MDNQLTDISICIMSQMRIELKDGVPLFTGKGIFEALYISKLFKKVIFIAFDKENTFRRFRYNNGRFVLYLLPYRPSNISIRSLYKYVKNLSLIIKIFNYENIDIIKVENIFLMGINTYLATIFNRIPYFLWVAGPELKIAQMKKSNKTIKLIISLIYKLFAFLISKRAKVVVSISPESNELFRSFSKNFMKIFTNFVDIDLFKPFPCTINKKHPVILYVGRLEKEKGIDLLIRTINLMENHKIECEFWIIGYGSLKNEFFDIIDNLNFVKLNLLGKKDIRELPKYYNCADILVFPSLVSEGAAATVLEAMACGVPVIGTTGPIINGITGFLVSRNSKDIFEKINILLSDPNMRSTFGKNARIHIIKLHNKYIKILKKIYLLTKNHV